MSLRARWSCRIVVVVAARLLGAGLWPDEATAQRNTVTFDNRSGEPALVKLVGPSAQEVEVPDGQSRTAQTETGEYYILVRYGQPPAPYRYSRGESFQVTQTATQVSSTTITLHKVKDGNYESRPTTAEEFDRARAVSRATPPAPAGAGTAGGPAERLGQDGAPMVLVPAGSFDMGTSEEALREVVAACRSATQLTDETCRRMYGDEAPVHRVALDAFYLDTYEVTNTRFQTFVRETGYETTAEQAGTAFGCTPSNECKEISGANWRKPEGGETVFVSNRAEHPVVSVSWQDAEAYCRWAGKRLPTEAEFEYANRGGTQTPYWWGEGNPGSRRVANIGDEAAKRSFPRWTIMAGYDDGYARTAPVGSFEANPFGLHDTAGNVSEWTGDWYEKDYYKRSPSRNPTGPSSGKYRVLRGGSWYSGPQRVRSADRNVNTPSKRSGCIGVRCAKTP